MQFTTSNLLVGALFATIATGSPLLPRDGPTTPSLGFPNDLVNFPIPPGPPELTCTPYDGTTPSVLPHAGFADCLRALYVLPDVGNVPRTGCLTDSDLVVLAESLSSTATCRIATWSRIGKAHCIQYDVVKAAAEKIILGCKSREVATGRTIVGGTISLGGGRNGDVEGVVVYAG